MHVSLVWLRFLFSLTLCSIRVHVDAFALFSTPRWKLQENMKLSLWKETRKSSSNVILQMLTPTKSVQTLDYTSLFISVHDLSSALVPCKVENVLQTSNSIFLGVKTLESNTHWIQACWHPSLARIGIGFPPTREEATEKDYSFASTLRALLKDTIISNISILKEFERIAVIEFCTTTSTEVKWKLIVEIAGSRSNTILVSASNNEIRACAYQVSSTKTVRPIQTLLPYHPPPPSRGAFSPLQLSDDPLTKHESMESEQDKSLPSSSSSLLSSSSSLFFETISAPDTNIEKSLMGCCQGMSPNVARKILEASGIAPTTHASVFAASNANENTEQKELFFANFKAWASIFQQGALGKADVSISPSFNRDSGEYCCFEFPSSSSSTSSTPPFHVSSFLRDYYTSYHQSMIFEQKSSSCQRKLALRLKKAQKLLVDFQAKLEDSKGGKADSLKSLGDLVTAFTYSWKAGDKESSLVAADFETGEPIVINLPDGLTPVQYAQKLYKSSKKMKRSALIYESLLEQLKLHLDYLGELDAAIDNASSSYSSYDDILALRDIEEELDMLDEVPLVQGGGDSLVIEQDIKDSKKLQGKGDGKKKTSKSCSPSSSSSSLGSKSSKKGGNVNGSGKEKSKSSISTSKATQGLLVIRPSSSSSSSSSSSPLQAISASRDNEGESDVTNAFPPVVVGRSARQNDRVTFQIARDHHLWFHVQGCPGAHVVLLLEPGQIASQRDVQYASDIAAFFSKAKGSTQVPVVYCKPKYLSRPAGAKPGMVSIMKTEGFLYGSPQRGSQYVDESKTM